MCRLDEQIVCQPQRDEESETSFQSQPYQLGGALCLSMPTPDQSRRPPRPPHQPFQREFNALRPPHTLTEHPSPSSPSTYNSELQLIPTAFYHCQGWRIRTFIPAIPLSISEKNKGSKQLRINNDGFKCQVYLSQIRNQGCPSTT